MKWYLIALKKYAVFKERSGRMEFWMFVLISIIIAVLLNLLDYALNIKIGEGSLDLFGTIYSYGVLIPTLAVGVRRIHDIGKSGLVFVKLGMPALLLMSFGSMYLAFCISSDGGLQVFFNNSIKDMGRFTRPFWLITIGSLLIGIVLFFRLFVLLGKDSQPHDNKWGSNPNAGELTGE